MATGHSYSVGSNGGVRPHRAADISPKTDCSNAPFAPGTVTLSEPPKPPVSESLATGGSLSGKNLTDRLAELKLSKGIQEHSCANRWQALERFFGIKPLGKIPGPGNYGTIYKGLDSSTGKMYVIKDIKIDDDHFTNFVCGESAALRLPNHPNVVKTHALIVCHEASRIRRKSPGNNYFAVVDHASIHQIDRTKYSEYTVKLVVCDLVDGVDLIDISGSEKELPFCAESAIRAGSDIAQGLMFLHAHEVAHRDLKPENIIVNRAEKNRLQILDFGFSKTMEQRDLTKTPCGSPMYVAPEVVKVSRHPEGSPGYGLKADVWALGAILMAMSTGVSLDHCSMYGVVDEAPGIRGFNNILYFSSLPDQQKLDYMKKHFHDLHSESPGLVDLIVLLTRGEPDERITAAQVVNYLDLLRSNPKARLAQTEYQEVFTSEFMDDQSM